MLCVYTIRVHVLGSSGCLASHRLPSGMLLQRWPSSPDCQQKAVSSARFVPRHWTVPGTLGQANWTCVMKLITHMHAHTSHTHTHRCCRQVRGSRIYNSYLLPSPLSKKCDSSACFWCMHRTAIMVHYWEVTEMEQRVLIDVGAGAGCHYSIYWAESGETLPTKWPRSTNMAPAARSKWFTSDDRHKMLNTFICCVRVFGIPRVATQSKQSDCSDTSASSRQSVWMNIYTWHLPHCTVQDVKGSVRKKQLGIENYVQEHCKFPHWAWVT